MLIAHEGNCQCGTVSMVFCTTKPLANYSPRACDCDFCISNNVSYLSEPQGSLSIKSRQKLTRKQQGSGQATFLCCGSCDQLIAVLFNAPLEPLIGAVNSQCLVNKNDLSSSKTSSPKLLTPTEKRQRWAKVGCLVQLEAP